MTKKTLIVLLSLMVFAGLVLAQQGNRNCPRANQPGQQFHTYDLKAPLQLKGEVVKVESSTAGKGRFGSGIHLTVKASGKSNLVHMGPAAYYQNQGVTFKKGQKIALKVYKGTGQSAGSLFGAAVTVSGKQLVLRDDMGRPQWRRSVQGRGQGQGRSQGRMGKRGKRGGRGMGRGMGRCNR